MGKRRGHGEGSIYRRRSDGRWCGVVDLGFHEGKRRRKVVYGRTRKEVAEKLRALQQQAERGELITADAQTLAAFLEHWLETVIRPARKPQTAAHYSLLVRCYIVPHLGTRHLTKLTPDHIQGMLSTLLMRGATGGGALAPGTTRQVYHILRQALGVAQRWGLIARNAASLVDAPRVPARIVVPFTPTQSRALLATLQGNPLELLFVLALTLGLRRGELLGLCWAGFDEAAGTITVRQQVQVIAGEIQISSPKSASSRRTLPLAPALLARLRQQRANQDRERATVGADWNDHDLIFPDEFGMPFSPNRLEYCYYAARARALVPKLNFHMLRHTVATRLAEAGTNETIISAVLGHSQRSMTGHYTHATMAALRLALDTIAMDLLGDPQNHSES